MAKQNCWEFKECGREPGGAKVGEMGVCPAADDAGYDGSNEGKNAGRICWAAAGTFCAGKIQGTFAQKLGSCQVCDFFKKVNEEEGPAFISFKPGQWWFRNSRPAQRLDPLQTVAFLDCGHSRQIIRSPCPRVAGRTAES